MLLERTITQLAVGAMAPEEAQQLGQLGYMQWIAGLPGNADYRHAAVRAHDMASPFIETSPAIAEFCKLLVMSVREPLAPLPLALPPRKRRGGAAARRSGRAFPPHLSTGSKG